MENIDLKLIQSDQAVDKKVLEVYEYLKLYKEADERNKWIERREKAWNVIENEIWEPAEIKDMKAEGQVPFVVPKGVKGVQGSAAVATSQKPEAKFLPIGSGDLYVAELIKRGFDIVWEKNEGNDTVYDFQEEVDVGAHSFISIKLDKSKNPFGRIEFEEEPPDDIYWNKDSRKRDYSDTHLIKAKQRSLDYIKEHYPDIKEKDLYFLPTTKEDGSTSSGITTGDNYAEPGEPDSIDPQVKARQKIIWEIDAWLLKTVKEDWFAELGKDGQPNVGRIDPEVIENLEKGQNIEDVLKDGQLHWPRMVKKRVQRIIVGKKLVSEDVNPEGVDSDGEPVMTLIGLKAQRTRSSYCMSKTNYARDLIREKSKRRIQAIHAASNLLGGALWYYDSVDWQDDKTPGTAGSHARVSKDSPHPPMGRLESGAIDVMQLMRLEEKSDREIDDVYDLQDVVKGKLPEGKPAWQTILALQDSAGVMSSPSRRKLESAIVRLAKVIVAMMLKYWPRYQWERLLEDDERTQFAPEGTDEQKQLKEMNKGQADVMDEINEKIAEKWEIALELIRPKDITKPPGLSLIDVDVKVVAGSSMPTNRIAKGQMAIEYVKAGIYDEEAALEYVDDPNKDKIIERIKLRREQEMKLGALKK